jgi:hypothetical protein
MHSFLHKSQPCRFVRDVGDRDGGRQLWNAALLARLGRNCADLWRWLRRLLGYALRRLPLLGLLWLRRLWLHLGRSGCWLCSGR